MSSSKSKFYVAFTIPFFEYESAPWSGIYHEVVLRDKDSFQTVCKLDKTIKECFNIEFSETELHIVNFHETDPQTGRLCKNCAKMDRTITDLMEE